MTDFISITKSEFLSLATNRDALSDIMYDEREWYVD